MGLIVLSVAILPLLGVGGSQIIKAETTGPLKEHRLTPRIADTAKALYIIYLGVSVACAVSYHLAGMEWEDAIMHMMTTVSLSGISTHDASFGYFNNPAVDAVGRHLHVDQRLQFFAPLHCLATQEPPDLLPRCGGKGLDSNSSPDVGPDDHRARRCTRLRHIGRNRQARAFFRGFRDHDDGLFN